MRHLHRGFPELGPRGSLCFSARWWRSRARPRWPRVEYDRACLKTLLDQYLRRRQTDPSAVPLMVGFRQTENAIAVRPGTGLWKSMTGLGAMQRRYFDRSPGRRRISASSREGWRGRRHAAAEGGRPEDLRAEWIMALKASGDRTARAATSSTQKPRRQSAAGARRAEGAAAVARIAARNHQQLLRRPDDA